MAKMPTVDFNSFFNIVNGERRSSATNVYGIDPSTESRLWDIPVATKEDIEDAVTAANDAFPTWRETPIAQRVALIEKFKTVYDTYRDEFVNLQVKENGKPHVLATWEMKELLTHFDHTIQLKIPEEKTEDEERVITTRYMPVGVVAAICPWNFPVTLAVGKILPAILAGCCVIVKPSPFTPYSALKIVELAQHVFPPGVVQALGGDDSIGPALVDNPRIQKVSFTGSIATGKRIMASSAGNLKRLTLELGGNDPAIILRDVDIAKVAPEVAASCFMFTGQVCVATKRIYVHESIYEPFLKALVDATTKMKVGSAYSSDTVIGPLQNKMQYDHVQGLVDDSKNCGYQFALGLQAAEPTKGYIIRPCIVDNPPEDSRIVVEEQFGPIVPIMKFTEESEVISRANATKAGLAACVWGSDAERVGRKIEAGSVFINSAAKITVRALLSGHKESSFGGGEWGATGVLGYCNPQVTHVFK